MNVTNEQRRFPEFADIPDATGKRSWKDPPANGIGSRTGPDRLASSFIEFRLYCVLVVVDKFQPLHFAGHAQTHDELLEKSTASVQNAERILARK